MKCSFKFMNHLNSNFYPLTIILLCIFYIQEIIVNFTLVSTYFILVILLPISVLALFNL